MSSETDPTQNHTVGVVAAAPWRVTAVSALPDYRLAVTFRDGSSAMLDCSALRTAKHLGVHSALADAAMFDQVSLELGVITWPNGADLDPHWIYQETRDKNVWSVPY